MNTGLQKLPIGIQSFEDLRRIIEGVELRASAFSEYRVEANNPIPVIYQSGYLTIKDYDREFQNYTLAFPNEEVEYGFLNFIVPFYFSAEERNIAEWITKD